jgi:lysophospholipase L1-like esterase
MRFTALGDSVTVGLGDPLPSGGWRGWAGLLAESLSGAELHNLASCGARARDVADIQLPRAIADRPTVASVVVGINDTLRGQFSIAEIARDVSGVVATLTGTGAVVLTARLPDPGRMLGLPEVVCRPLVRRIHAINAVIDDVALRHSTVHVNLAGHPEAYHPSMWGIDRLHPSERGHRMLARLYAVRLAQRGLPVLDLPGAEPANPPPTPRAQMLWLATKGTGWLARRSCDLVPALARMVAREWWYERHGRTAELDERLQAELDRILPTSTDDTAPATRA